MKHDFERYLKLRLAIQDWVLGTGDVLDIAKPAGMTASDLRDLLSWHGLSDLSGRPLDGTTVQDVFNLIFFLYTLSTRAILAKKHLL